MLELSCIYCSFYHPSFSPSPPLSSPLYISISLPLSIYQSLFPSIPSFHYISLPISKMPLTTSTCGRAVLWETICLPSRPELVQEVRHCRKVLDFMPFPVPVTLPTDTWVITVYRPGILPLGESAGLSNVELLHFQPAWRGHALSHWCRQSYPSQLSLQFCLLLHLVGFLFGAKEFVTFEPSGNKRTLLSSPRERACIVDLFPFAKQGKRRSHIWATVWQKKINTIPHSTLKCFAYIFFCDGSVGRARNWPGGRGFDFGCGHPLPTGWVGVSMTGWERENCMPLMWKFAQ